jgi:hypothetical protein
LRLNRGELRGEGRARPVDRQPRGAARSIARQGAAELAISACGQGDAAAHGYACRIVDRRRRRAALAVAAVGCGRGDAGGIGGQPAAEAVGVDRNIAGVELAAEAADSDARRAAGAVAARARSRDAARSRRRNEDRTRRLEDATVGNRKRRIATKHIAGHAIEMTICQDRQAADRDQSAAIDVDRRAARRTADAAGQHGQRTARADLTTRIDGQRGARVADEGSAALDDDTADLQWRRTRRWPAKRRNRQKRLADKRAACMRKDVAAEQRVVDRQVRRGGVDGGRGDRAVRYVIARRQDHRSVGIGDGRCRIGVADVARHQHADRDILRDRDHVDALGKARRLLFGSGRRAAVREGIAALGANRDVDVEQAAGANGDVGLFGGDIGRRAVDGDRTRLRDARCDERDITAARLPQSTAGVDLAVHRDRRGAARCAAETDRPCRRIEKAACRVDIVARQH